MRIVRNSILIFLTLTLIITIPLALILQSLSSSILKPYNTFNYFDKSSIYQELEKIIEEKITGEYAKNNNIITVKLFTMVSNEFVTDELIAVNIRSIQNSTWDYILGKTDKVEPISTKPFLQEFYQLFDSQMEEYAEKNNIPLGLFDQEFKKWLDRVLPDSIDFMKISGVDIEEVNKIKQYYYDTKKLLYILYLVIIAALLIGFIILVNIKRFFRWFTVIIISGVSLILIFSFVLLLFKQQLYNKLNFTGTLAELDPSIFRIYNLMLQDYTNHLLGYSLVLLLIAIGLIVINKYTKNNSSILIK